MFYQQVHPLIRQEIEEHSFCKLYLLINFKYAPYLYNYQDLWFLVLNFVYINPYERHVNCLNFYAETVVFQN